MTVAATPVTLTRFINRAPCPSDRVRVADFCIDRYEARISKAKSSSLWHKRLDVLVELDVHRDRISRAR